jgi:hypothetical protein
MAESHHLRRQRTGFGTFLFAGADNAVKGVRPLLFFALSGRRDPLETGLLFRAPAAAECSAVSPAWLATLTSALK